MIIKKYLNILLTALLIILAVTQVIVLNQNSTIGLQLTQLMSQVDEVENQNSSLSRQVASESAVVAIYQKARKLGFEKSQIVVSLSPHLPLAFLEGTSL